ncbi:MAG: hypothetical protein E7354_03185 [Clostridiales bacterium]|nr:hypothetical protein [Clostridiales bacterium]
MVNKKYVAIRVLNFIASNNNRKFFSSEVNGFMGPVLNPVGRAIGFDNPDSPFMRSFIEAEVWYRTNSLMYLGEGDIFSLTPNPNGVYMQDMNCGIDIEFVSIERDIVKFRLLSANAEESLELFKIYSGGIENMNRRDITSDTFEMGIEENFRVKKIIADGNDVELDFFVKSICVEVE